MRVYVIPLLTYEHVWIFSIFHQLLGKFHHKSRFYSKTVLDDCIKTEHHVILNFEPRILWVLQFRDGFSFRVNDRKKSHSSG